MMKQQFPPRLAKLTPTHESWKVEKPPQFQGKKISIELLLGAAWGELFWQSDREKKARVAGRPVLWLEQDNPFADLIVCDLPSRWRIRQMKWDTWTVHCLCS